MLFPARALAAALTLLLCGGDRPARAEAPNVVLYVIDTLRADHLGCYGYSRATSPSLDAFAHDAVRFARAYSTSSWTRPATASILTGLHPLRHRAITRANPIVADVPLLSELLHGAGYRSEGFVTNVHVSSRWGFGRGFDSYEDVEEVAHSNRSDAVNREVLDHLGKIQPPFFLYLHVLDPHSPYDAPPPFADKWREHGTGPVQPHEVASLGVEEVVAAYDQEIAYTDHNFGELVAELKRRGWYDNSIIVVTADHGEEFLDHGGLVHGHTLFEELVRVPLLLKLPGNRHAGTSASDPVSVMDIAPTILRQAGLAPAARWTAST